jgi:hypothetical protein
MPPCRRVMLKGRSKQSRKEAMEFFTKVNTLNEMDRAEVKEQRVLEAGQQSAGEGC